MEKCKKRGLRRWHKRRVIKNRLHYWGWKDMKEVMPKHLHNKIAETPCSCSCSCCGNPRKWHNEITITEYKSEINFIQQCQEAGYRITKILRKKHRNYY